MAIPLSCMMDAILSREIPSLNLTNTSCGTNRGVGDVKVGSKAWVEVAFRFSVSQDVRNQTADTHSMVVTNCVIR